jgi:hypothetical protein
MKRINYGMVRCFACGADAELDADHVGGELVLRCSCTCGAPAQKFRQTPKGWELLGRLTSCFSAPPWMSEPGVSQ